MIKSKCSPIVLYGIGATSVNADDVKSLELVAFMKIFTTYFVDVANDFKLYEHRTIT